LAFKEKAEAAHQELENGSRPQEIAASKAEFDGAAADLERLKNDLNRARDLQRNNPGAITPEQLDQANAAFLVGQNRYAQARQRYDMVKEGPRKEAILQARAAREQARAQYRLVKEGPRKEVIDQARARVAQAGAAVQAAETRLGYAAVASPLNGVVLSKNTEPGEYVAPGTPVVTVADIENVWLRAYVDARDIGTRTVVLGSEAEITTDAYPQKVYRGRVSFIASEQEFTPKAVQTNRERVKFVYRIKIDVKNPDKELKPGMPADARIVGPKR
jgi:HlyD family secretion protein